MILLVLIALLFLPSDAASSNSFRVHLADPLQLKCDALPYRTVYYETRCYFAVFQEVKFSEASAQCSSLFDGSKVATEVSRMIFNSMMLEKSKFHVDKDSKGAKQIICIHDTGYTCDQGEQSTVLPGKCFERAETKMSFQKADQYCKRLGMEVPRIDNEMDNQMIRGAILNGPVWLHNTYEKNKWQRQRSFSKYSTCDRPNPRIWAGNQMRQTCTYIVMSSLIDRTGYWGNHCQLYHGVWDVICVKDADNDFTTGRKPCPDVHQPDEESGVCEWTGPKDSCAKLIDFWNKTWFVPMPDFPKQTYNEFTFTHPRNAMNDVLLLVENRRYGEHNIPCYETGELAAGGMGLTRVLCYCDPTEANLNDHEPAPPPKKKCIEHHVFNETTQSCEWKHEPKFCGELITYDGRRQMVEIPNWPTNRAYNADHWNNATKQKEDFHTKISDVIVRQHCWFTMTQWEVHTRRTLQPVGYGKHQVASYYNGLLGSEHDGTHRVICQCIR